VLADGTLRLINANISTNAATILLDGLNSNFYRDSGTTDALANLATNATGASFTIQNGRNFTTAGAFENDGALVVGNNSTFTATGADTDTGTLSVLAAGTMSLPGGGTASGTVSVAGTLIVGANRTFTDSGDYNETGTLQVQAGATATLSGTFDNYDGVSTLTRGTYDVLGTLRFANAVVATNAANIILDGAGARVTDLNGTDALGPNLALNAAGADFTLLHGAGFTTAADFENDGTLTVGAGSAFNVSGNFTQGTSATLEIQLGGTGSGQSGRLAVTGQATLTGTLLLTPVNGYVPQTGDAIHVLAYGSRSGDFTTPPPGFTLSYDDVNGILTVIKQ
jgi:hypothetical protein